MATEENKEQENYVNLKVKSQVLLKLPQDGHEIFFKIKKHTPLQKLMQSYCGRMGLDPKTVRFLYDGEKVKDDDTAEKVRSH